MGILSWLDMDRVTNEFEALNIKYNLWFYISSQPGHSNKITSIKETVVSDVNKFKLNAEKFTRIDCGG